MDLRTVFMCYVICFCVNSNDYTLKQVVILSRHNLRTPLAMELNLISPNKWPHWNEKRGYLTAKGALLEGYLGKYFSEWLTKEGLLDRDCPDENKFFVYANTQQRTMATAYAFVKNAFPKCNITVHHSKEKSDLIFNPIIHNTSLIFKEKALRDMQMVLDKLNVNSSYKALESILDYKHSEFCITEGDCDLTVDKNQPIVVASMKPNVRGPLKTSKSAIDSFIMENYEGFPLSDVAWGQLIDHQQWESIIGLSRSYHDVIFNVPLLAKDISKPLVKYLSTFFLNDQPPKVTLLVGHDANLYTILQSMHFKPYSLEDQHEVVPIGGKVVFQKWYDSVNDNDLLKVEYVYQSTRQMRESVPLSLANPPKRTLLELEGCQMNSEGYCPWKDFVALLRKLL